MTLISYVLRENGIFQNKTIALPSLFDTPRNYLLNSLVALQICARILSFD